MVDRPDVEPERQTARDRRRARRQRRHRAVALVSLFISAGLVAIDASRGASTAQTPAYAGLSVPEVPPAAMAARPSIAPAVAQRGPGTFTVAPGQGLVAGRSGRIQRYRVAVENGVGVEPEAFAAAVEAILSDPRGWTAGGDLRLQRVSGAVAPVAFTIYLATPETSEAMCRAGWLETEQFTNCRLSDGRVVINLARWLTAVPEYGAQVDVYRAYAINHEVGHQLGHGHESCPGLGRPAPVMQQQTLGLRGCVANGWPYVDGARYRGPAAPE